MVDSPDTDFSALHRGLEVERFNAHPSPDLGNVHQNSTFVFNDRNSGKLHPSVRDSDDFCDFCAAGQRQHSPTPSATSRRRDGLFVVRC